MVSVVLISHNLFINTTLKHLKTNIFLCKSTKNDNKRVIVVRLASKILVSLRR